MALLALLAPDILILAAPLFLANLLSSFPLQYAGELHYSAPLVPYVVIGGALGLSRLIRLAQRALRRDFIVPGGERGTMYSVYVTLLVFVLLAALTWQAAAGYTPIGREYRRFAASPGSQITAHHELLARFAAQIPAGAPLSAAADLYPHLSHRELIYRFPWLGEAEYALVDVAGRTDMHPIEVRDAVNGLLAAGWGVTDAAGGYLLLAKEGGASEIPDAFNDFARAPDPKPQYPLDIIFGDGVRLIGYDLAHDLKWRTTQIRLYWEALEPMPEGTEISVQMLSPTGEVADDTALRPMPAEVWYPPERWRTGETVVMTTLPWYLPAEWAPVIGVRHDGEMLVPTISGGEAGVTADGRLQLPAWSWRDGRPEPMPEPSDIHPDDVSFMGADWSVALTGHATPETTAAGSRLPVNLRWQADGPADRDYTVFMQLRDAQDRTVAQADGTPTWFTPRRTDRWPDGGYATWDAHTFELPADLDPGAYRIVLGWYDLATGERLALTDGAGNAVGDEYVLGTVRVTRTGRSHRRSMLRNRARMLRFAGMSCDENP